MLQQINELNMLFFLVSTIGVCGLYLLIRYKFRSAKLYAPAFVTGTVLFLISLFLTLIENPWIWVLLGYTGIVLLGAFLLLILLPLYMDG